MPSINGVLISYLCAANTIFFAWVVTGADAQFYPFDILIEEFYHLIECRILYCNCFTAHDHLALLQNAPITHLIIMHDDAVFRFHTIAELEYQRMHFINWCTHDG
jgi:hypothetical protein